MDAGTVNAKPDDRHRVESFGRPVKAVIMTDFEADQMRRVSRKSWSCGSAGFLASSVSRAFTPASENFSHARSFTSSDYWLNFTRLATGTKTRSSSLTRTIYCSVDIPVAIIDRNPKEVKRRSWTYNDIDGVRAVNFSEIYPTRLSFDAQKRIISPDGGLLTTDLEQIPQTRRPLAMIRSAWLYSSFTIHYLPCRSTRAFSV